MTLLVCGSRDWTDQDVIEIALKGAIDEWGVTHLVHGAAPGADTIAAICSGMCFPALLVHGEKAWWDKLDVPGAVIRTRRDGSKYNVVAGHQRNQRMLDLFNPDVCLAFSASPITRGTQDMVNRCLRAGIPTYLVTPDGNRAQLDRER